MLEVKEKHLIFAILLLDVLPLSRAKDTCFDSHCVVCCIMEIQAALRLLKQALFKLWR